MWLPVTLNLAANVYYTWTSHFTSTCFYNVTCLSNAANGNNTILSTDIQFYLFTRHTV